MYVRLHDFSSGHVEKLAYHTHVHGQLDSYAPE
jgi:hypothetical protein